MWNYRVVRRQSEDEWIYAIHEVYYSSNGEDQTTPDSITVDPVFPQAETLEELMEEMSHYLKALEEPVLEYDSLAEVPA